MSFHSLNLSPELLESARGILEQYGKKPPENKNLQGDEKFPKEKNGKKKKKNGDDDDLDLESPDTEKVTINPRMNESMDFAKYGGKLMKTYVTSDAVPGGRRQFNNVIEFSSVKSANRFMEASKSYGVLDADVKQGRDRGRIVVAKMSDKGVPYKENSQGVDAANRKVRKGQMGEEHDQTTDNNYGQLKKFKRAVSITKKKGAKADGEKKILRPKTTSEQLETPEERKREQAADKRRQKNAEMAAKRAEERAKMLRDRAVKTEESLEMLPESTVSMFRSIVNAANPREKADLVSGFAEKELDQKGKKRFQKILARVRSLSAAELDKLALELSLHKLPDAKREMMRKQIQKLDLTGKGFNIGTQMSPVFENDETYITEAVRLPAKIEDLKLSTLIVALEASVVKKTENLPNSAPVVGSFLKALNQVKKELKGKESLKGEAAYNAFATATNNAGFTTSMAPMSTIAKKYKTPVDKYKGKLLPFEDGFTMTIRRKTKGFDEETQLAERELTDAEKRKKEEIVKALKRDHPDMDKSRMYAIATDRAKKSVNEEFDVDKILTEAESLLTEVDTEDKQIQRLAKALVSKIKSMDNSTFWKFVEKAGPIIKKFDTAEGGDKPKRDLIEFIKSDAKRRTRDPEIAVKKLNVLLKSAGMPQIKSLDEDIQLSEELYDYPRTNDMNSVPTVAEPYKSKGGMWTTTVDQEHNHDFNYGAGYTNPVHGHTHQIKYDKNGNPVILGGGTKPHSHKVKGKLDEGEEPGTDEKIIKEKIDPAPERKPYRSLESTIREMLNKR